MTPWEALEATQLALFLKQSRWIYPLVNAGHILGIALLVGAVIPVDVALLRGRSGNLPRRMLPWAAAGLALAVVCGALLFVTQATDYAANGWFRAKIALVALAALNALLHRRLHVLSPTRRRLTAALSLALWPAALICGRLIAYS